MKKLTLAALAMLAAAPAMAQWDSYHSPGSSYTSHTGPDGWNGQTYHSPGSSYSDTTWTGPNGQSQNCQTYHSSGSSYANTTCN